MKKNKYRKLSFCFGFCIRKWMIVDGNGVFKTLRHYPKMALINVEIQEDNFVLSTPGKTPILVPIKPQGLTAKKCRYLIDL